MALVLRSICFNTSVLVGMGSLYCRKDADTPINPVAELTDGKIASAGVFVPALLGTAIQITIQVENTDDKPINATIKALEKSIPLLLGNVDFPGTRFSAKSITKVSTTINTTNIKKYSNQTRHFSHQWKWFYEKDGLDAYDLAETTEELYVIPDIPSHPWNTNAQQYSLYEPNYIWTSLLDICCKACEEYSQVLGHLPGTAEEHVAAFTYELNQNPHFRYDVMNGAPYYSMKNGGGTIAVKLQKYIKDHQYLYNKLNCMDCATLVQIECLACGIKVSNARMSGLQPAYSQDYFDTNPIIAIGYTDWEIPFSGPHAHGGFSYHEVTAFQDSRDKDTPIYDACLKIDLSDYPGKMPAASSPYPKIPELPCHIPFAQTAQPLVQVDPNNPYPSTNQYYRERLVSDGQNCQLYPDVYKIGYIDVSVALQMETVMEEEGYLADVRKKYNLEDNPLPEAGIHKSIQNPDLLAAESFEGDYQLTEHYGRNRVYRLRNEDAEFRLELTFAYHEREAYAQLVHALSGISNPNIRQVELGDMAFAIEDRFYLFVKNNVLVRLSNETEGSDVSVETIAHHICDSL